MSTGQIPRADAPLSLEFDDALIRRYDRSGPRYTSYPTADRFGPQMDAARYRSAIEARNATRASAPLSLYFHLPFCSKLCFYCACNKIVTKDRTRAQRYLEYLQKEIRLQSALLKPGAPVEQLHWGGGTPTFFSVEQMSELMQATAQHFRLVPDGEYSIEIDPRVADAHTIAALGQLGFNRISLGVQDFDGQVQRAVNRVQSEEETQRVIDAARGAGFKSVSLDLIYGLPKQTVESFDRTLERVIALNPDRLSIYAYAHLPGLFMPQRRILEADLPPPSVKLELVGTAIRKLGEAGYVYIGMDHFAKPNDELAVAQQRRQLHRNFQGYSTHADCDLIAMGVTGIGNVMPVFSQNVRELDAYYERLDRDQLPVFRGIELSADDLLRRDIIQELMCHFSLSYAQIAQRHGIEFASYFAHELQVLAQMAQDGLVETEADALRVTARGRLLVRHVCMVFDAYLQRSVQPQRYSKVI